MTRTNSRRFRQNAPRSAKDMSTSGRILIFLVAASFVSAAATTVQAQKIIKRKRVCQVTGTELESEKFRYPSDSSDPYNKARSEAAHVYGTDIASPFIGYNGSTKKVRFFFGDTFGENDPNGPIRTEWRPNIMAETRDFNAANCINLYYHKNAQGIAKTKFPLPGDGFVLAYPTTGWHNPNTGREYASVTYIRDDGIPITVIEYSDDDWATPSQLSWFAFSFVTANFQTIFALQRGGYYYFYGARLLRDGPIQILRVKIADMDKMMFGQVLPQIYTHSVGTNPQTKCGWVDPVDHPSNCVPKPIVAGPVGDCSVMYNPAFDQFMMLYLYNDNSTPNYRIQVRWADKPEGPWKYSGTKTAINCNDSCAPYVNCYAPFLLPEHSSDKTVYFLMSRMTPGGWAQYNTCSSHGCYCTRDSSDECICNPFWCDPFLCSDVYNVFLMRLDFE